jgi:proteasome lid subunit RPN8/RPN11
MTINIEECAIDTIKRHAEGGYPNEVCGILLGRDLDGRRAILNAMPIENSFERDEQYHRFSITPQAMFAAERLARRDRMDVLGVYHSHPNAPARPSEYDREHAAWTAWTYVILSVQDGHATDMRAWRLTEDRANFEEVELAVGAPV